MRWYNCVSQSQHYAGVAFDVGQNLNYTARVALRNSAFSSDYWNYVEPIEYTPRWVHFDDRNLNSACSRGGYPLIRYESRGVYVLIAQDALTRLGYNTYGLDGIFGNNTLNAVRNFQSMYGLSADGIIGCDTWTLLTNSAVGIG